MQHQLTWKILPGRHGISCSEFRAVPAEHPDGERGVAVECAKEAERQALLRDLEAEFAAARFSNSAAAFEAVKAYVLGRTAKQ